MSILFYRRPDYKSSSGAPINASECKRYVERTKGSAKAIPDELSFDAVISNKPLPPCCLNDLMDYLIYVEHNAENLQFYLWYTDYERRWEELSANDQALSPIRQPELVQVLNLPKEKDGGSLPRPSVNSPAPIDFEKSISEEFEPRGIKPDGYSYITASATASMVSTAAEVNTQAGLKWQPFTIQPYRDECDKILRHYIAHGSPRELNLSYQDRAQIIHALQHTTHPSAFAPAFKVVEANLRGQSHPNFIRWSICNGSKPRVLFVRSLGVKSIVAGFIIAIILSLSHVPRWYRIFASVFWLIGFSTIIASFKGLCIILHTAHRRNLRPWELTENISTYSQTEPLRRESDSSTTASSNMQHDERAARPADIGLKTEEGSLPFERTSMNTFGPKNNWESERCALAYERRSLLRKIFEKTVRTQNETLQVLQDRIVLGATAWGFIATVPLTVAFVALPSGNYF